MNLLNEHQQRERLKDLELVREGEHLRLRPIVYGMSHYIIPETIVTAIVWVALLLGAYALVR